MRKGKHPKQFRLQEKIMLNGFIIFFLLACSIKSMSNNNDSLNIFNIKNQDLIKIIDAAIRHEKNCTYYNDSLLFSIHLQEIEGSLNLQLESIGNKKIQLENEKGCIEYQGHLFLVTGTNLDSTLFSNSGRTNTINYYKPKDKIDRKTGKPIFDIIEDDSFSVWIYRYVENHFVLDSYYTYCD